MPTLTLNGKSVSFQPGATILEAARSSGIDIPTLCWYPKLPIVGNCRICLVSVQGQNKLLPACATPAADGMVVETESKPAVDSRRGVLDFLLERYPGEHLLNRAPHGSNGGSNGGNGSTGEVGGGNGVGSHPRNELKRYGVHYDVPGRSNNKLLFGTGEG